MSQPSQPTGRSQPGDSEERPFTTLAGRLAATSAERKAGTGPPAGTGRRAAVRPTFTAPASGPAVREEEEPPSLPRFVPDDGAAAQPGVADSAAPADAAPDANRVFGAEPAAAEGTGMWPLPASVGLDKPLLSDAAGLRARWQRVQADFVDDPQQAVGGAADLIEQTAQALVGALRQRQRQLRGMWERGPDEDPAPADGKSVARASDTEHLRLMMQRYRALFNQLCRP